MTLNRARLLGRLRLAPIALALALAAPLLAQEVTVELDRAQTHIGFTLSDVLHTAHGTFKLKNGTIRFDPVTGTASGMVVVDTSSGDSGSQARDRKMHKEILLSEQYPETRSPRSEFKARSHLKGNRRLKSRA